MAYRMRSFHRSLRLSHQLSLLVLAAATSACAGSAEPGVSRGIDPSSTDGGMRPGEDPPACDHDNPYCQLGPDEPIIDCGNEAIDLTSVGVNIMVAVDGAASMVSHWPMLQKAVGDLRDTHADSAVGLHVFWGELVDGLSEGLTKANWCGNTKNKVLDVGDHDSQALVGHLGTTPPGPSFVGGLFETAPVIEPLNYYLSQATKLADPTRTNYLLFVTNGNDNCFGSVYSKKEDKLLAYEKLAVELVKLNIRLIPIGFDSSAKPGADGSFGTTNGNTDLDVLKTLLLHGGSGLTTLPKADDPAKLGEVLAQVGQTVRNCRFAIPDVLNPNVNQNPFELDFYVNGSLVPRDRLASEGWNFVSGDTSQVELFGQACQAVRAEAKLEARKTCNENVCGTAAIKVETKPRAVLYLFDVSASRIECADGTLGCLVPPGLPAGFPFGRTSMTYWETVEHALGKSLVAPINDDIEFGMQFFPGKDASAFSCDVAVEPEIPPAQGTEITILSKMLEKLPFGFSPVVQVLENVAKAPGRLADPDVQGAVVMLSDGGDNCSGDSQEQIVTRLGASAESLLAKGVKTYVIRYGSPNGNSAAQEAQLRTIAAKGGTATSDPADLSVTPYVDAKNEAELNSALASLSDSLASCSFALNGLPADADKSKANLYLNGEAIPFDQAQEQKEGWAWANEAQDAVDMFGEACTAFKTNRRTSVVVELGCAPIFLQ